MDLEQIVAKRGERTSSVLRRAMAVPYATLAGGMFDIFARFMAPGGLGNGETTWSQYFSCCQRLRLEIEYDMKVVRKVPNLGGLLYP